MGRTSDPHVLRLASVFEAPTTPSCDVRFDSIGGMQVHTGRLTMELDRLGFRQSVVTAWRPNAPRVQALGDRARVVRVGVPIPRFRQLYGAAAIPEIARSRIDLVHAHLGEDLAIAPLARWASTRSRAPLVVTLHCSVGHTVASHDLRTGALRMIGGPLERWLLRAADRIIVLTDAIAGELTRQGVARSKLLVAPLGIDLDLFGTPTRRPASMDPVRRWIAYVGRLVPEKGVRDLIRATALMRSTDASLLVVGDGRDRAHLERLVTKSGLDHRVTFTGAVPHGDVPRYVQHADVVVLPSWYEERGRILLEAMAAGTPVVATRTGGIPATVRHGVNGLLVRPKDPADLAAALDRTLADTRAVATMADAGRATAAANDIAGLVATTVHSYRSALGSGPAIPWPMVTA